MLSCTLSAAVGAVSIHPPLAPRAGCHQLCSVWDRCLLSCRQGLLGLRHPRPCSPGAAHARPGGTSRSNEAASSRADQQVTTLYNRQVGVAKVCCRQQRTHAASLSAALGGCASHKTVLTGSSAYRVHETHACTHAGHTVACRTASKGKVRCHLLKLNWHRNHRHSMEGCFIHAVYATVRHKRARICMAQHILYVVGRTPHQTQLTQHPLDAHAQQHAELHGTAWVGNDHSGSTAARGRVKLENLAGPSAADMHVQASCCHRCVSS
jgi:hypothetical protein